jgi:hypothetical protein
MNRHFSEERKPMAGSSMRNAQHPCSPGKCGAKPPGAITSQLLKQLISRGQKITKDVFW